MHMKVQWNLVITDKELFGHPKIVPLRKNVPYQYEINCHLVMGNGSLTPIFSLTPSLTVVCNLMEMIFF